MSATSLVLLLFLTVAALVVVSIADHLHKRQQIHRQRCLHFRRKAAELEEMAMTLEPLVASLGIPRLINEEHRAACEEWLKLEPGSQALRAHLERADALADDLADQTRPREINRLLESDADIARAQYYISKAAQILRRQESAGKLTTDQLEFFLSELSWTHLMVQVISMVGQGHKAMNRGKALPALAFYRKAQQKLMETLHSDNRRHAMIRELSEILAGECTALSLELMPESLHNPAPATSSYSA